MTDILIVVDMQKDFIDGALGTAEAQQILPYVKQLVETFSGPVYFTRDTHPENYLDTQEGKLLPVPHCIQGTPGWQIHPQLEALRKTPAIDKVTFGSSELVRVLQQHEDVQSITFVGLCTDICVISNVLITKAYFPEVPLFVDARGCAGVTPESHANALAAMKMCQVMIQNE